MNKLRHTTPTTTALPHAKTARALSLTRNMLFAAALALETSVAIAQFNPVPLTQSSYTFKIVVPSNTVPPVNNYGCWVGTAYNHGDTTYYEQGVYARKLTDYGGNSGVPPQNTVFTGTGSGTTNM